MNREGDNCQEGNIKYSTFEHWAISGVVAGIISFSLFYGLHTVDPTRIDWLLAGDTATNYFGWAFFRNEPWGWPLGKVWRYGMEVSSSIVYTDSLPLFAFIFKSINSILPSQFQYVGLWVLSAFMLQGYFGYLLTFRITTSYSISLLASLFFVTSPVFIMRLMHPFLCAHWMILAGFYLNTLPDTNGKYRWAWGTLLAIAILTHAYLAIMVGALWMADCLRRVIIRQLLIKELLARLLLLGAGGFLLTWAAGYFVLAGGMSTPLSHFYSSDILGLFRPYKPFSTEQYSFLGYGICLLLAIGLINIGLNSNIIARHGKKNNADTVTGPSLNTDKQTRFSSWQWAPLIFISVFFLFLSYLPVITFAGHSFLEINPHETFYKILGIFRVTGRLSWLTYYLLFALAFILVSKLKPVVANITIITALIIQIYPFVSDYSHRKSSVKEPLHDNLLSEMESGMHDFMQGHDKIKILPVKREGDDYVPFAYYASRHGMAINTGYYARTDSSKVLAAEVETLKQLLTPKMEPQAVYVLKPTMNVFRDAIEEALPAHAGIGTFGNYTVILPNRLNYAGAVLFKAPQKKTQLPPEKEFIDFATEESMGYLLSGWGGRPEVGGHWTLGDRAILALPNYLNTSKTSAEVSFLPFISPINPVMNVAVSVNDTPVASWNITEEKLQTYRFVYSSDTIPGTDSNLNLITFHINRPISPRSAKLGGDPRPLGIHIKNITVFRQAHPY